MPYPCSHFYFDIKFGDRLYSKEKRRAWPVLTVTTWIGHKVPIIRTGPNIRTVLIVLGTLQS